MNPAVATLAHDNLTDEQRVDLSELGSLWEARALTPAGSALRGQLEKRMASLEIRLGL